MKAEKAGAVHRELVAALEAGGVPDERREQWLAAADWGSLVERMRAERFGDLPADDGCVAIGRLLGERYLESAAGSLLRQSIELVPPGVVFSRLLPAMSPRLRRGFEVTWRPQPSGGVLRVIGRRATPAAVTLGFFQAFVALLGPTASIELARETPDELEFVVGW